MKKEISLLLTTITVFLLVFVMVGSIKMSVYAILAVLVLLIMMLKYDVGKNTYVLKKVDLLLGGGLIALFLYGSLAGANFDLCIGMCLGGFLVIDYFAINLVENNQKSKSIEQEKEIFRERRADIERLMEYLSFAPIVGINGSWGSGKSFVVDRIDKNKYEVVKIDLLACNLDEIQVVLLNELNQVLESNGVFSRYAPKIRTALKVNDITKGISRLLGIDAESYTNLIKGFRNELRKTKKIIVIVFEDLDRINDVATIKKIFGIVEKVTGDNIKAIYQYDLQNLKNITKNDEKYLEKYIPYVVNITDISFPKLIDYLFKEYENELINLNKKDFQFLQHGINVPIGRSTLYMTIPNITIRKAEHLLKEITVYINKKGIYEGRKREVIAFYLLKHFYYDAYNQLALGRSLIDTFKFSYKDKIYTLIELWKEAQEGKIDITLMYEQDENKMSALIFALFQYHENIYGTQRYIVGETQRNLINRYENEAKDRLVWNLLGNGKSEFTNQQIFVDRLVEDVLKKNDEEQKSAFEQLEREMFYGDHEKRKRDNETIFLFGVPNVISMFQACLVVGLEPRLWERFIDTYFRIKKVECITCELVEALTYCEVHSKELYLSILCKFNKLKIKGNMNDKKVYIRFLQKYLRLMFQFGYTRMNGGNSLENLDKMTEGFMEEWIDPLVLDELCDMRNRLPIQGIREDIQILIMFVEKNKDMIKNKEKLEPRKNFDARFGTISQESPVKRINAFTGTDEEFYKLVKDAYDKDEISAYEVGLLDRLQKEEDIERFN